MNTAILDLGTNTFNLLVRSAEGALVFSDKLAVRLGAGGLRDGVITPEAEDRAVAAVAQHLASARAHGAARSFAFATSAIASDGGRSGALGMPSEIIISTRDACGSPSAIQSAIPSTPRK
jgi:exopolyphosphatase/guanosine-5'-triphosphate,3'-diphosphate pyrophosphatase